MMMAGREDDDGGGSAAPAFALNACLAIDTPAPPIAVAADWAASFPAPTSPYSHHGSASSSTSSSSTARLLNLAQGMPGIAPSARLRARFHAESAPSQDDAHLVAAHAYTPVFGVDVLRDAIARDVNARYAIPHDGRSVSSANVAVTAGANLAFAVVAQALAGHGDAIVLTTPWYFNHQMTLASLGIKTIALPTQQGLPSIDDVQAILSQASQQRIKAVVLVSPNNPCGITYPAHLLDACLDACKRARVALVLDETYRDFVVNDDGTDLARPHALFERDGCQSTLIHISSFSKSYVIPGHRLGYLIAHASLLLTSVPSSPTQKDDDKAKPPPPRRRVYGPIAKALDNLQICPPRADSQRALAWAIEDAEERAWRRDVALELHAARSDFVRALDTPVHGEGGVSAPGVEQQEATTPTTVPVAPRRLGWEVESLGGYYAFVRTPFEGVSSEAVARAMAALVGVVVLPDSFFLPTDGSGSGAATTRTSTARVRISLANVARARLAEVPGRLVVLSRLWEAHGRTFSPH